MQSTQPGAAAGRPKLAISYNGTSTPSNSNVKTVIDGIVSSAKVDTNRIYVAGFSWGGQYTNSLVAAYPGFFAAAAPMSPVSMSSLTSQPDLAYWLFINAYNQGQYQSNYTNFANNMLSGLNNARATRFESNEAFSWPYNQFDQPDQRPNPNNNPALGDQVAHEVEAAVLYNKIDDTENGWSIVPTAGTVDPKFDNVFDWMFAQSKTLVLGVPEYFEATAGDGEVALEWAAPIDNGFAVSWDLSFTVK